MPMNNFSIDSRSPDFDFYYAAIDGETGEIVAVGMSAPGVLALAAQKTGRAKDCFAVREITRERYEGFVR
jgi:hypothetical protein